MDKLKSYFDIWTAIYTIISLGLIIYGDSVFLMFWLILSILALALKAWLSNSKNLWNFLLYGGILGGLFFWFFWFGLLCVVFWFYVLYKSY